MEIQRRLLSPCSTFLPKSDKISFDLNGFVYRLLLFDTYILQSTKLKDIPHLLKLFGYEGLLNLLNCQDFKIHCPDYAIAQTGQTGILESRRKKGILPLGSYSFEIVRAFKRKDYISDCFKDIKEECNISEKQFIKLKGLIASNIEPVPDDFGKDTIHQLKNELSCKNPIIKQSIVKFIEERIGKHIKESEFSIKLDRIDEADFCSETDLDKKLGLNTKETHAVIERGLLGVAGLNERIEEMKTFNALSGFMDGELPLFDDKLKFIEQSLSPNKQERRMSRIVKIKGFPHLNVDNCKIDVEKLLEIRQSPESIEFRKWLTTIDSSTDQEISDRINGILSKISPSFHSKISQTIRFLVGVGIGIIPGAGYVLGPIAGAIDQFLINKLLPYDMVNAFINKQYPSIFKA